MFPCVYLLYYYAMFIVACKALTTHTPIRASGGVPTMYSCEILTERAIHDKSKHCNG
jgi:hypothetical protein